MKISKLSVVDSLGRPPAGILRWNFFWMGAFQQCREVIAMEGNEELFRGKYCKSQILRGVNLTKFDLTIRHASCIGKYCASLPHFLK